MSDSGTVDADVIVVGGGSCGSVVASRLSEDPDCRVLLIEAGPGVDRVEDYPADVLDAHVLPVGPASPWAAVYPAELTDGIERQISRGRILGGSGAVNGAYFVRARPEDFLRWPSSWTYEDVLPYFRASETDHDFRGDRHGDSGPMPVSRTPVDSAAEITRAFVESATGLGFGYDADKNDPRPGGGVGPVPLNTFHGTRVNAAAAYVLPHIDRENLSVYTDSTVLELLFDGIRAAGVKLLRDGAVVEVRARTVVLSAGAIRSPQLLMLSGIGPADQLRELGIAVRLDHARVGRGFSDHPEVGVYYRSSSSYRPASPIEAVLHVDDLEIRAYTSAFDRMIPGLAASDPMIGVGLMRADSRGEIGLESADALDPPSVRYHYVESAADRRALGDGLDIVEALLARAPLRRVAEAVPVSGDRISSRLGTALHMSGSCAMGEDGFVLDDHCRVQGIEGVAVVDTSAMPIVPTRGPHATAIMLAERASALLRPTLK